MTHQRKDFRSNLEENNEGVSQMIQSFPKSVMHNTGKKRKKKKSLKMADGMIVVSFLKLNKR